MTVGAAGGAYQTAMFQEAGIANAFSNVKTVDGVVIRVNQAVMSTAAKKTVQAAAQNETKK